MSNSKTKLLFDKNDVLVGYRVTNKEGDVFDIPVLDNRNPKHQERILITEKEINSMRGSRHFAPSYSVLGHSYNVSRKK